MCQTHCDSSLFIGFFRVPLLTYYSIHNARPPIGVSGSMTKTPRSTGRHIIRPGKKLRRKSPRWQGVLTRLVDAPMRAGAARFCSPASIWFDVGVLGHLFPHAELNLNESSQFLRCAGKSLEAHVLEACLNVRAVDDFA